MSRSLRLCAGAALLVLVLPAGAASAAPSDRLLPVPSKNRGVGPNQLSGVSVQSPTDVWAVGHATDAHQHVTPLIEHFDGQAWTVATTPHVAPSSVLDGVSGSGASDVWAVGSGGETVANTLIEHWDGTAWTTVPAAATAAGFLDAVSARTSADAWAVGSYSPNGTGPSHTLTEHWDGTTWTLVPAPSRPGWDNELTGVTAIGASDVWAVGDYFNFEGISFPVIEHYDGSTWKVFKSPAFPSGAAVLFGVSAVSSTDIWAVGDDVTLAKGGFVEHFDGHAWAVIPTPDPSVAGTFFHAIVAHSSSEAWLVGSATRSGVSATIAYAERWNGSQWNPVSTGGTPVHDNFLAGVSEESGGQVWAVGYQSLPSQYRTLTMRNCPACA